MNDLISRKTAINEFKPYAEYESNRTNKEWVRRICTILNNLPSAQQPALTCDGCRHVGTYDTDFPCSGCIRREKDYYESER